MARGVEECHRVNVIIVDLKPDNVLIRRRKKIEAYITDYSWAYVEGGGTPGRHHCPDGRAAFHARYRHYAPELLDCTVHKPMDIYCLGHILQRVGCISTALAAMLGPLVRRCKDTDPFRRPLIRTVRIILREMRSRM